MFFKVILFLVVLVLDASSSQISSNDNYFKYDTKRYSITYTKSNFSEFNYILTNIDSLLDYYEKLYGYSLDEKLDINLITAKLQIANAFSTQYPNNSTSFYSGGALMLDYFSSKNWIDTLLIHEIAHNYQTNAKKSRVSRFLHKSLGNNITPIFPIIPLPLFTLPNYFLPTYMLEGNSVLNESVNGIGGRLNSGRFKALKNSLIKAGKITPEKLVNLHLDFPFTEEKYIIGGFYMEYLASIYGLDRVNGFFYEHSEHYINPFRINSTYYDHFGVGLEKSIEDFVKVNKTVNSNYKEAPQKNILAKSLDEVYLTKDNSKVYFITGNYKNRPILNIFDSTNNTLEQQSENWLNGLVFNIDNKFYTSSAYFISADEYKVGLFDKDRIIKDGSESKFVVDIKDGSELYIDVNDSYRFYKLYLDNKLISNINSEAILDKYKNSYYFVQKDNKRVLFKNSSEIFSFTGYYSKVVDVIENRIYFIASTKHGSSLFCFDGKSSFQVNDADNIINAKVLGDTSLLVTIDAYGYNIIKDKLSILDKTIYEDNHIYKQQNEFVFKDTQQYIQNENRYSELKELRYSTTNFSYGYSSANGTIFELNSLFADPLLFNQLMLFYYGDSNQKYLGFNYLHDKYIPIGFMGYGIKKDEEYRNSDDREYGATIYSNTVFARNGKHSFYYDARVKMDDEDKEKNELLAYLGGSSSEDYALNYRTYNSFSYNIKSKYDRGDKYLGFDFDYNRYLGSDFDFKIDIKGMYSNLDKLVSSRGLEVTNSSFDAYYDYTSLYIAGIDNAFNVKDYVGASIDITKTFYGSIYYSIFPVSLRKETLYYKYSHYEFQREKNQKLDESIIGIELDLLFLHKLVLPITIEYIQNSYSENENQIMIKLVSEF